MVGIYFTTADDHVYQHMVMKSADGPIVFCAWFRLEVSFVLVCCDGCGKYRALLSILVNVNAPDATDTASAII